MEICCVKLYIKNIKLKFSPSLWFQYYIKNAPSSTLQKGKQGRTARIKMTWEKFGFAINSVTGTQHLLKCRKAKTGCVDLCFGIFFEEASHHWPLYLPLFDFIYGEMETYTRSLPRINGHFSSMLHAQVSRLIDMSSPGPFSYSMFPQ